ncbi:MAG: class I SAM-dependent methyltransferase [Bacteroidetes bacterium]|nr:class I SAM-dependent methyltransferase [Bacteroidota bacterium]
MHHFDTNKQAWNQRVEIHYQSEFYDVPGFLKGKEVLKSIELALLGDIKDKTLLHLQCHFGQDSLSLVRLGAQVTGIDFSQVAIDKAVVLARQVGLSATFICGNVLDTPQLIPEKFDIVFTTYGVLGWLPDMNDWAKVVKTMLKPGGKLILVEFHPVLWMLDDEFTFIAYSYFKGEPIIETKNTTYTDQGSLQMNTFQEITWNHSLDEVMSALLAQGLKLTHFKEYPYSPYPCFRNMKETKPGQYQISDLEDKIPMVYALTAENEK